jgi:hypothetical protein
MICTIQYCSGDNIENNEIGGEYRADGRGKRSVQGFGREA